MPMWTGVRRRTGNLFWVMYSLCQGEPLLGVQRSRVLLPFCHDPQCSGACQTYFPQPWTRCVDPGSILPEQHTILDEATKVGMQNTDAHTCAPSLFTSQCVYIYPTSTGNFPSLEIN